jgi:hypothetical protein
MNEMTSVVVTKMKCWHLFIRQPSGEHDYDRFKCRCGSFFDVQTNEKGKFARLNAENNLEFYDNA